MKIRMGIICPSEIAFRRFIPALSNHENFEYVGVAVAAEDEWTGALNDEIKKSELAKAKNFADSYGGRIFSSYSELIQSDMVDAVYLPLPPALHYMWGRKVLECNKHLFMEKPFTVSLTETKELIELAEQKKLAVHENYMFVYHSQLEYIKRQIDENAVGDIRLIRIDFGFPFRNADDFRYNKALGGGALLDCGGYTLKLASMLLGNTSRVVTSNLNYKEGFDIDIYGSATIVNDDGLTAQISFGMDNSYKCSLELWGSDGTLFTNRIFTAPVGFEPTVIIRKGNDETVVKLKSDDTFGKSISFFEKCVNNDIIRNKNYEIILNQSKLINKFKGM